MVKEISVLLVPLTAIWLFFCAGSASAVLICPDGSLSCALSAFDRFYHDDYERFWQILHASESRVVSCTPSETTVTFLQAADVAEGNAEFFAYFAGVLEKRLLLENTDCLVRSVSFLDETDKLVIVRDLQRPIYLSPESVRAILQPYRENPEHREWIEQLFSPVPNR